MHHVHVRIQVLDCGGHKLAISAFDSLLDRCRSDVYPAYIFITWWQEYLMPKPVMRDCQISEWIRLHICVIWFLFEYFIISAVRLAACKMDAKD